MSCNESKPWERPWTTQEMIENASKWSLAGDAGLLKYLEDFSEKMLAKVKDTNDKLNDLIDSADETSLALNNATNEFMGLRNTQFIESRVYEDDETLSSTKQEAEKEEVPKATEAERLEEMKKAIFNGLEIIDKYYEKVEIPESDSDEDDTDEPSILYRPVDPYIDRPLPYVIGTAEWHKYWHVGLGHSSSDSEVENEQDQFSETESEQEIIQNLPARDRSQIPGVSDSESEDIPKRKITKPVANSTFNDDATKNMFDSGSESETGSLPPQMNTVNSNFAEELAAKLGKVESAAIVPEVNTKPIKKAPSNIAGGLFSDEPPPLDDDDIFVNKNMSSGLFSGGDNLFDDEENDNDFWNTKKVQPTKNTVGKPRDSLFSDGKTQDKDLFIDNSKDAAQKSLTVPEQPKKSAGLFDEDGDDLFSTASVVQPKKPIFSPFKPTNTLLSEEPPELDESNTAKNTAEEPKRKKPVGGISVLGPNVLLSQQVGKLLKNRALSSSESENDSDFLVPPAKPTESPKKKVPSTEKTAGQESVITQKTISAKKLTQEPSKPQEPSKIPSLFDDTSPLFSDDIFANVSTKKFTSNLFDPEPPALDNELFKPTGDKPEQKPETGDSVKNKPDLLFAAEEPPPLTPTGKNSSLFDDDDNNDAEDLFPNSSRTESLVNDKRTPMTAPSSSKNKKSSGLFDDEDDDLFSAVNKSKSHSLFDPNPPALNDVSSGSKKSRTVDLFDPNPPELDESDGRSESQVSVENEPESIGSTFIYDIEPPLLSNESSGIVRDQSTRVESVDTSFNPSITSSRRHSSDIFQDHQNSDSLFSAKSKLSVGAEHNLFIKTDLTQIPEQDTMTKIEITPSGNESSLVNDSSTNNSVFLNVSNAPKPTTPETKTAEPIKNQPESDAGNENLLKSQQKSSEKQKSKNISLFEDSDSDDDLFSNKSSGSKYSNTSDILNNSSAKPGKILKNKNIFEDDVLAEPQNVTGTPQVDLFGENKLLANEKQGNVKVQDVQNVREKNDSDIFRDQLVKKVDKNVEMKQEKQNENSSKKFNYKDNLESEEDVKNDPKKSLSFEKTSNSEKVEQKNEEVDGQTLSSASSPGKLKHNLNINVAALIPGASPPRKQNLEKSVSLDSSSEKSPNIVANEGVTKSEEKLLPESRHSLEKSVSLDYPVVANEILSSAAKERVRIPVKRRPSTRRARQEAIRKSAIDLNFDESDSKDQKSVNVSPESPTAKTETENILNVANNNVMDNTALENENVDKNTEDKLKTPLTNPLSPSTDEEDFLTIPREQETSDSFEDNSLFGKAPVISPVDLLANEEQNKKNIEKDEKVNLCKEIKEAKPENLFNIMKVPDSETGLFSSENTNLFTSNVKPRDKSILSSSDSDNDLFATADSKRVLFKNILENNNLVVSPDEDLFKPVYSSLPVSGKHQSKLLAREDSLFDEEDIFSTKKIPPKSNIIKKPLFDDDEDDNDDDIFGGSSSSTSKLNTSNTSTNQPRGTVRKTSTSSRLKKLTVNSAESIDDPLEALKK